ncbi:ABC transporter permease [uncultured Aeromicrobium sp.]|uniref:ABC transporter permease n=1 Tax=uncultured Aeromicrobium sp. TaxID=337820 RepID=UPI0025D01741|nr:ABC transporter permease subunit [uncultured Aeromicrobium sp.]
MLTALSLFVVAALWWGLLLVLDVSPYVGKSPWDVVDWLFLVDGARANRTHIAGMLAETLSNAAIGFSAGLVAALIVASAFQILRGLESAIMPLAMLLRSVPLIALAPVIITLTGRGSATVGILGGIVVFFPALVTIAFGLGSVPPPLRDLVAVSGGGRWSVLRRIAYPASLPTIFAAVRISVPGAITGALLAEWLATGSGIGYGVMSAIRQARNDEVWASVVVVTVVSILLYNLVVAVERVALRWRGLVAEQ